MASWIELAVAVVSAALASSGMWAYITKRSEKKDVKTRGIGAVPYDSSKTDATMANYTSGYLTYKAAT